jgi:hypothetical protein
LRVSRVLGLFGGLSGEWVNEILIMLAKVNGNLPVPPANGLGLRVCVKWCVRVCARACELCVCVKWCVCVYLYVPVFVRRGCMCACV